MSEAYHSLNFALIKSLADLFTLKSIGCKQSVQLGGTYYIDVIF